MSENKVSGETTAESGLMLGHLKDCRKSGRYAAWRGRAMIAQFKHRAYKQAISDRLSGTSSKARIPDGGGTERIFNRTMFVVMGKLAKLDGLVVDGEIQYATTVMQLLDLNGLARQEAIDYFELGKQRETDVMPLSRS